MSLTVNNVEALARSLPLELHASSHVDIYLQQQTLPVGLTLYWIDQEIARIGRKVISKGERDGRPLLNVEQRLCELVLSSQYEAAVAFYLQHFAEHRFEDGAVPYPRGVLPHQQNARYQRDIRRDFDRAAKYHTSIESLLKEERLNINVLIRQLRDAGQFSNAQADERIAKNTLAAQIARMNDMSEAEKDSWVQLLKIRHATKDDDEEDDDGETLENIELGSLPDDGAKGLEEDMCCTVSPL